MTRKRRILAFIPLLLRLGLVLALFVMLGIAHPGMTAMAATPQMTQHHAGDMSDPMGGIHDKMNGALCAMLCSGDCRMYEPAPLAQFEKFAILQWTIDADPSSSSQHPDAAQRPPDTAPSV